VTAHRPILAAVDAHGITKALLDSHGAALTAQSGDATALVEGLNRLRDNSRLVEELIAGAEKMRVTEFGEKRGRECLTDFVHQLATAGNS
jgi:hypothetical protein